MLNFIQTLTFIISIVALGLSVVALIMVLKHGK